jgi:hypothetical protein
MFVDSSGKMKLGTVIATVALGGLGAYLGSGSGIMGMLGFGAAGAVGGTLLGPMVSGLLDSLLGTNNAASFARTPMVQATPDAVTRTQQPILQPGAPTVNTTLVTPNLDRFAALNSDNASLLTSLEQRRRAIENLAINDPNRARHIDAHLGAEGTVQQYSANAEEWNRVATEWNRGERNTINTAYNQARSGLGFAAPAPGAAPALREAPTGNLNIPRPGGTFGSVSVDLFDAANPGRNRAQNETAWNALTPRQQNQQAMLLVEERVALLRPGGGGPIDWSTENASRSWGRTFNNVVSLGGNITWWNSALEEKDGTQNGICSWGDCKRDAVHILRDSERYQPTNETLDNAMVKIQNGIRMAQEDGNQKEADNFRLMEQYVNSLRARGEGRDAMQTMNRNLAEYVNGPANEFKGFVTEVQGFRDNVNQMNQQVASLNQQQVRVKARGATTTPPDANKQFITVIDDRNNTTVTMVAEKVGGNWQVTNSFQGDFNAANVNETTRLQTPMPSADIFTDNGIKTTANLGNTMRQVLMPMQARLGLAAPTVAVAPPTVGGSVSPLATPTGPAAAPGLI